jgi:hypothetical protein
MIEMKLDPHTIEDDYAAISKRYNHRTGETLSNYNEVDEIWLDVLRISMTHATFTANKFIAHIEAQAREADDYGPWNTLEAVYLDTLYSHFMITLHRKGILKL